MDNPVSGLQRFFCHVIMSVAMIHKRGLEPNVAGDQVFRKPNTGGGMRLGAGMGV